MDRWDLAREADWKAFPIRQPPIPPAKFWNRRAVQKCEAVELRERLGNLLIRPVDLPYPIHCSSSLSAPSAVPGHEPEPTCNGWQTVGCPRNASRERWSRAGHQL